MRFFTAALVMLAMLASAHAQGMGRQGTGKQRHAKPGQDQATSERKKSDDKAYKSALDKIPPAEKPDPWKNMR